MLINIFKLKKLTIFLFLIIYTPIGYIIFTNNFDKVNFISIISSARLSMENFCYTYNAIPDVALIDRATLDMLEGKYTEKINSQVPGGKRAAVITYLKDRGTYRIFFGGKSNDLTFIEGLIPELRVEIEKIERANFEERYKNIKLHCGKDSYSVFNYVNPKIQAISIGVNRNYSIYHLLISSFSPLLLIYLFIVIIKYIKFKVNLDS